MRTILHTKVLIVEKMGWVETNLAQLLEQAINDSIRKGFQPQGAPFTLTQTKIGQLMVKYEEQSSQPRNLGKLG